MAKTIALLSLLFALVSTKTIRTEYGSLNYEEKWGYTDLRKDAHMFWWLYYTDSSDGQRPLIMWLQGGPGASSSGFGNFMELGPLDVNLKQRNATWLHKGDLIFVDNPVGTGFSYVTDDKAYTTDVSQIADDLVRWAKQWFSQYSRYKTRPFYITCESYGGKMSAAFAKALHEAIKSGDIEVNLKGVGLGDSWISPIDYVNTWPPYLYSFSYLGEQSLQKLNNQSAKCQADVDGGHWLAATVCWSQMETLVQAETDFVSFYNVLMRADTNAWSVRSLTPVERLYHQHVRSSMDDQLKRLMNGQIRKKLKIIPDTVTWGGQSGSVFQHQQVDFMKPVISTVDYLLANTSLKVAVYNGQLDLICDTLGTEKWMSKLKWPHLKAFQASKRTPFHVAPHLDQTAGFYRKYKNLQFYWILRSGHMVPHDTPNAAFKMLDMIFED